MRKCPELQLLSISTSMILILITLKIQTLAPYKSGSHITIYRLSQIPLHFAFKLHLIIFTTSSLMWLIQWRSNLQEPVIYITIYVFITNINKSTINLLATLNARFKKKKCWAFEESFAIHKITLQTLILN